MLISDLLPPGTPAFAYAVIALGLLVFIYAGLGSDSPRKLYLWPAVSALIGGIGATVSAYFSIASSKSSTAAVGYIFLPVILLVATTVTFVLSWSLLYAAQFVFDTVRRPQARATSFVGAAIALLVLSTTASVVGYQVSRHRLLARASVPRDAEALRKMVDQAISSHDVGVLSLLAKNHQVSVPDLVRIFDSSKRRNDDVNSFEYSVVLSLADNPHTPPNILAVLAAGEEEMIRLKAGMNPSTPTEALWQLSKDSSSLVRHYLAANPAAPEDLLHLLAQDPDRGVRDFAETHLKMRR